jgi:hypothetical protein
VLLPVALPVDPLPDDVAAEDEEPLPPFAGAAALDRPVFVPLELLPAGGVPTESAAAICDPPPEAAAPKKLDWRPDEAPVVLGGLYAVNNG